IVRSLAATRSLQFTRYVQSVDEIREAMRSGDIYGAVVFPSDLEEDIKSGRQATVVVYRDAGNIIVGNMVLKEATATVRTVSAGILLKKFRSSGMNEQQAMNLANPIRVETQSIGNPGYNYMNYLMPGLLPFMLQLAVIIAAVLVINGEEKDRTLADLFRTARGRVSAVIGGKLLAHLILHTINALLMLAIVFPLFGVDIPGSFPLALLVLVIFIIAVLSLGLCLSSLFHDQTFVTQMAAAITVPSFIFSGFTFPLWSMPGLHVAFAHLLPFTYFMSGFIKAFYLGDPLSELWPEMITFGVFFVLTVAISAWRLTTYHKVRAAEAAV
ncbi:MAG: ABC transporter permease, partial [candidate division Zixibacteria bacterium]|nr:ABC transporter permease [candidate division Zixibacteria bacterium]